MTYVEGALVGLEDRGEEGVLDDSGGFWCTWHSGSVSAAVRFLLCSG